MTRTAVQLVQAAWTAGRAGDEVTARHLGVQAERLDRRHAERGLKVRDMSIQIAKIRGAALRELSDAQAARVLEVEHD